MPDPLFNKYRAAIEVLLQGRDVMVEGMAGKQFDLSTAQWVTGMPSEWVRASGWKLLAASATGSATRSCGAAVPSGARKSSASSTRARMYERHRATAQRHPFDLPRAFWEEPEDFGLMHAGPRAERERRVVGHIEPLVPVTAP